MPCGILPAGMILGVRGATPVAMFILLLGDGMPEKAAPGDDHGRVLLLRLPEPALC